MAAHLSFDLAESATPLLNSGVLVEGSAAGERLAVG